MGQQLPTVEDQKHRPNATTSDRVGVLPNLSQKSTAELEQALIHELRRMEQLGSLPDDLREKLCRHDVFDRQIRTGMRFGMVIGREEFPELQADAEKARSELIELCLTGTFFVQKLPAVA